MASIDNFDHKILKLLQGDGRMTITELSNKIGLSKTPCLKRIKKLEAAGYITVSYTHLTLPTIYSV